MAKFLFLILTTILCHANTLNAQSLQWAAFGHGQQLSVGQQLTADYSGNSIIGGNFNGSLSFGNFNLTSSGDSSNTLSSNSFIAKYDSMGNPLWAKQISTTGKVTCTGLATDSVGNIYAGGIFDAPIMIDTISLPLTGTHCYYIAKYNPAGQVLWAVSAGNIYTPSGGTNLTVDKVGNVYFCGSFIDTLTIGSYVLETPGQNVHSFMAKYSASGSLVWVEHINSWTIADRIYTDGEYVFVSGNLSGNGYFDSVVLINPWNGKDFLVKYDTAGTALWAKSMGTSTGTEAVTGIVTDEANNIYFTGYSYFGFVVNDTLVTGNHNGFFAYVVKLNAAGQIQWSWYPNAQVPGVSYLYDGESRSYGVSLDNTGRVILTGYFDLAFRLPELSDSLYTDYYNNLFVLALDSANGNPLAAFQDGGTVGEVAAYGMALHPDGSVMVTGAFGPSISLQHGPTVMSQGSADVFLAKYSSFVTAAPEPVPPSTLAVTVYPNPTSRTVNVSFNSRTGGQTTFTVRDITGRIVSCTQVNLASGSVSHQLNVSGLNAGMYLLQVQTGELSQTLKLVKL